MSDKPTSDPGPGAQGTDAARDRSNNLDPEALKKLLGEVVDEKLSSFRGDFEKRIDSLENFRNQTRRHAAKDAEPESDDGKGKGKEPTEAEKELARLREEMDQVKAEKERLSIRDALEKAMSPHRAGLAEGVEDDIRDAVLPYVKLNSSGEAVYDRDGKHRPISEVIGEKASRKYAQAPTRREAIGRDDAVVIPGKKDGTPLDVKSMSSEEFAALRTQIESGKVQTLNDSE